ncbi:GlsB/YeaQ/YmgE family stress response membrane protein [soil metagenome]
MGLDALGWIGLGLVVGILAQLVLPGREPGGMVVTILLGIAGALLGGYVGQVAGFYDVGEWPGFIGAAVGAVIALATYRLLNAR